MRTYERSALVRTKLLIGLIVTGILFVSGCTTTDTAVQPEQGLQIVLKDLGMPDVWYLQPTITEIQLQNQGGNWITIWSDPEGKAVKLTPDGAEMVLDTVSVPAGTYVATRLWVSTMGVGVDVTRDGDISDENVEIILTVEEFNALPHPERPSAPEGGGSPPERPEPPEERPERPEKPQGPTGSVTGEPEEPQQPPEPEAPQAPYRIEGDIVYTGNFMDEVHTDTLNTYIVPQWGNDFVYSGSGGKIIYDFTMHPLLPKGQQISIEVSVVEPPKIVDPATALPTTVLLDDFNGATKGKGVGALTYEDSPPNLGKAANLAEGTYIKYSFAPWYKWDGAHTWNRSEAAPGMRTEGRIEMWIQPRQYSGIVTLNWRDAASTPQAGYILHLGLNADGKLAYSVWGGNLDTSLVGKTTIPLDTWSSVAVGWGPDGTTLYVNGEEDASTSKNMWPAFTNTVFAYLNYWGGDDLGLVDDLHISKVAEPPAAVLAADVKIDTFTCSDNQRNRWGALEIRGIAAGTAQGPVGTRLELPDLLWSNNKDTCADWTFRAAYTVNGENHRPSCYRKAGQPETTTWRQTTTFEIADSGPYGPDYYKNRTYSASVYMDDELTPLATDTRIWC